MNKRPNPFQPSLTQPPQPSHPPPPPPPTYPPPTQDWAAYWAAGYNPSQPGLVAPPQAPPNYDPALYRNYGYGGSNPPGGHAWQQRPPQPVAYPHAHPQPQPQQPYQVPYPYPYPQQPQQQPQQIPPPQQQPQPQPPQVHYGPQYPYPPPHPAKRPRFEPPAPPPPRPPLHFKPGGGMVPAAQLNAPLPPPIKTNPPVVTKFPLPPSPITPNGTGVRGGGVSLGLPKRGGGGMGRGGGGGATPMNGRGGQQRGGGGMGRGAYNASNRQPQNRNFRQQNQNGGPRQFNAPSGGTPRRGLPSSSFNFTPTVRGLSPFTGVGGKRTLTDFRIVGFGFGPLPTEDSATPSSLDWSFGDVSSSSSSTAPESLAPSSAPEFKMSSTNSTPLPPRLSDASRMIIRFYFQCPDGVTSGSSVGNGPGQKRKKDEEENEEEGMQVKRKKGDVEGVVDGEGSVDLDGGDDDGEGEEWGVGEGETPLQTPVEGETPLEGMTPAQTPVEGSNTDGFAMEHKEDVKVEAEATKVEDGPVDIKEEAPNGDDEAASIKYEATNIKDEATDIKDEPSSDAGFEVTPSQASVEAHLALQTTENSPLGAVQPPVEAPESPSPTTAALDTTPSAPDSSSITDTSIASVEATLNETLGDATKENTTDTDIPDNGDSVIKHSNTDPLKEEVQASATAPTISPSPNRISISYAGSSRRLVLDADVVEDVKIRRAEGRIDITLCLEPMGASHPAHEPEPESLPVIHEEATAEMAQAEPEPEQAHPNTSTPALPTPAAASATVETETELASAVVEPSTPLPQNTSRGILASPFPSWTSIASIEALNESTQAYSAIPHSHAAYEGDPSIPPLAKYPPGKVRLTLYLDKDKPLSEPKWVKSGDIEDWLSSMVESAANKSEHASWSGKISIVDPDPAVTVYSIIDNWTQNSVFGPLKERRRFVAEHLRADFDNVVEILLRLVRREGFAPNASLPSNPLVPANFAYTGQQTAVSMAVLSLYKMVAEYSGKAGVETKAMEARVGSLIRTLPHAQVHKALDGMFKEWSGGQKKAGGVPRS